MKIKYIINPIIPNSAKIVYKRLLARQFLYPIPAIGDVLNVCKATKFHVLLAAADPLSIFEKITESNIL